MFTYFPQSTPDWIPHFADCPQHDDQPASDVDCACDDIAADLWRHGELA